MVNKERVLHLLEKNATITSAQLAVMLDEEIEEIERIIADYEDKGIINGYKALVNWEKTEVKQASALIEIKVTPQLNTGFDDVARRIMEFPEVESVYLMSGGFDLAVMVRAKTMSDIAMFVAKRLAPIGGILSTSTHFVLTRYKDGGVEYDTNNEEIDERGSNLCD